MMMKRPLILLALWVAAPLASAGVTADAKPRLRKLTYDVNHKEWVEDSSPLPGTPEADLHQLRRTLADKKYRQADSQATKLIKKLGENHSLYPDLLIARAEAQIGRRRLGKAHLTLLEFLNRFSGSTLTADALRLEFVIAESYLQGEKRRWRGIPLFSGKDDAIEILDEISINYPDSRLAELAIKTTADHMFDEGDHSIAELEYARLLREYPQSRYAKFAMRRIADAALASFGGIPYDEAALVEAEERYEDYRRQYPATADQEGVGTILESIRVARSEKDFAIGAYYDRTGHYGSAIYCYRLVYRDWPETIAAGKAAERLRLLGADKVDQPIGAGAP